MATQEEKELRKKVIEDIKRKRAAAAQAEGVVGAAERGEYGDVGQGQKGDFDDIIDQGGGDDDPTVSAIIPSPDFSKENHVKAVQAGGEAGLYFTPIIGDLLSAKDSVRAAAAAQEAEGIVDKIKLYGLSGLAAAGALPVVSFIYDAGGPTVKRMIDDAIKQSIPDSKLAMAGGIDNFGIGNLFNLLKRDDPRVQNPGTGSGMPGIGTGRGPTEREIVISNQRQFVNTKLEEIWNAAPKNEKGEAILPTNWFRSKEVKKQIYDENPVLFTEWKEKIGSWDDFTEGFLAGKVIKKDGQRTYTGEDAVTASKLPVSGSTSAFDKATLDFREAVAKKLNVDTLNPQDQTLKYLNFIRLSESDELLKNPNKFFNKYKFDDLNTSGTKLNQNFERFKILDNKRIELRDDPEIQALIQKIFPDEKVTFQIAHTFESGLVRKNKVSKSKQGKGGDPDEMYIDLSAINVSKKEGMQKDLESKARKLEELYNQTGDSEFLKALQNISARMKELGVQGETVTQVGSLQSGFVLGSKDVKFSTKLETLAKDKGIKLTDEDYATMLKADNIIDPPTGFSGGGVASIDYMTRPLNA